MSYGRPSSEFNYHQANSELSFSTTDEFLKAIGSETDPDRLGVLERYGHLMLDGMPDGQERDDVRRDFALALSNARRDIFFGKQEVLEPQTGAEMTEIEAMFSRLSEKDKDELVQIAYEAMRGGSSLDVQDRFSKFVGNPDAEKFVVIMAQGIYGDSKETYLWIENNLVRKLTGAA